MMTSQINPQNIDGTYPVAGQDNSSQGFRDNFTNTKTNFAYAAEEITDLQNKVVLKAPLTGTTLDNDMAGSILSNAQLQDMSETAISLGSVSGARTIDYTAGSYYTLSTGGSVSLAFTGWPNAGQCGRLRLRISVTSTSHSLTIAANNTLYGVSNIQGYVALNAASGTIYFNQVGTYEFEFESTDSGETVIVIDQNRNLDPIYLPSSEDLAAAANVNTSVTMTYFTTSGTETATLPSAPAGLIKILYARDVAAGNMVVTVSSGAAWGGAGNIVFANTGAACTLYSTGGGWVCIGNNGAIFE